MRRRGALPYVLAGALGAGICAGLLPAGAVGAAGDPLACRVETTVGTVVGRDGLELTLVIGNTGGVTIDGWTLRFTLAPGQTLSAAKNAQVRTLPPNMTIVSIPASAVVAPGAAVRVTLAGTYSLSPAAPTAFTLNDVPCAVVANPPVVITPGPVGRP